MKVLGTVTGLMGLGCLMLLAAGQEPTTVKNIEAYTYQVLLGSIGFLISVGIAVGGWWAKAIMGKMCKIEESADRANGVIQSLLREIGEIKVAQTFTTKAIDELRVRFEKPGGSR